MFYIGGRGCVLCQFIESVTFARCPFIFALWNIALGEIFNYTYIETFRTLNWDLIGFLLCRELPNMFPNTKLTVIIVNGNLCSVGNNHWEVTHNRARESECFIIFYHQIVYGLNCDTLWLEGAAL